MWNRIREILKKEFRQVLREPRMRAVLIGPPLLQLDLRCLASGAGLDQCLAFAQGCFDLIIAMFARHDARINTL